MIIVASICAAVVLFMIAAACLLAPTHEQCIWRDDTDCSGIVLHTVRALGPAERRMLWEQRYWLFHALGDKHAPRLPLSPPPISTRYPQRNYVSILKGANQS